MGGVAGTKVLRVFAASGRVSFSRGTSVWLSVECSGGFVITELALMEGLFGALEANGMAGRNGNATAVGWLTFEA